MANGFLGLLRELTPEAPHNSFYYAPLVNELDLSDDASDLPSRCLVRVRLVSLGANQKEKHEQSVSALNSSSPAVLPPLLNVLRSSAGGGCLTTPVSFLHYFTLTVSDENVSPAQVSPLLPNHYLTKETYDVCLSDMVLHEDILSLVLTCKRAYSLAKGRCMIGTSVLCVNNGKGGALIPSATPAPSLLPSRPTAQIPSLLASFALVSATHGSSTSCASLHPVFENDGGIGGIHPPSLSLCRLSNGTRFLPSYNSSPTPNDAQTQVLLTSYPRSGNTLLRTLLTRVTRVQTGSDTLPSRPLSHALALAHSLPGEGIIDPRVKVIKTHYPERAGYAPFSAKRVVLLVRNPWDAIDSYWNMCLTNTHTESVTAEVYSRYATMYSQFVVNEADVWARFIDWWVKRAQKSGTPLMVVRFEDLTRDTASTMSRIMHFVNSGVVSVDEESRIRELEEGRIETYGSYRPRSGGIGKSLSKDRFTDNVIDEVCKVKYLDQLGYNPRSDFPHGDIRKPLVFVNEGKPGYVKVNAGEDIRKRGDRFGRYMTTWRREETKDDTVPFSTVKR